MDPSNTFWDALEHRPTSLEPHVHCCRDTVTTTALLSPQRGQGSLEDFQKQRGLKAVCLSGAKIFCVFTSILDTCFQLLCDRCGNGDFPLYFALLIAVHSTTSCLYFVSALPKLLILRGGGLWRSLAVILHRLWGKSDISKHEMLALLYVQTDISIVNK